jgi:hypothetical protein
VENFIDVVDPAICWSSSDHLASTSWYGDHLHKFLIYILFVLVGIWEIDWVKLEWKHLVGSAVYGTLLSANTCMCL